jgi:hypothetical protein
LKRFLPDGLAALLLTISGFDFLTGADLFILDL